MLFVYMIGYRGEFGIVSGLTASLSFTFSLLLRWVLRFRSRRVRGWWLRRIARVLTQLGPEFNIFCANSSQLLLGLAQLSLQGFDKSQQFLVCRLLFDLSIRILSFQKSTEIRVNAYDLCCRRVP